MTETLAERSEFDPPPPGGMRRALGWAIRKAAARLSVFSTCRPS